jgi:hypothetical protein
VLGFNTLRVWLLNISVVGRRNNADPSAPPHDAGIHPDQYPDFYPRLRAFAEHCGAFTVFTGAGSLMPGKARQQQHLDRTADALRGLGHVLIELVNEGDQYDNAPEDDLTRPAGVLISRGSNGADSKPPRHDAPWDYELYHSNGLDQWQRKVGHNAMEWADQSRRPCVSNENTRYADQDSSEIHAEDGAENGALLCAGSCYHSTQGKYSRLFTGLELAGASAWVRGARKVPLEFQRGQYSHPVELEGPNCIRAHRRRLPDGRDYVSLVRP